MTEKPGKARERHHRQLHVLGQRQAWKCAYCGCRIRCRDCDPYGEDEIATWDHIHPRSRGGTRDKRNLALACPPCNNEKGDLSVKVFLGRRSAYL